MKKQPRKKESKNFENHMVLKALNLRKERKGTGRSQRVERNIEEWI